MGTWENHILVGFHGVFALAVADGWGHCYWAIWIDGIASSRYRFVIGFPGINMHVSLGCQTVLCHGGHLAKIAASFPLYVFRRQVLNIATRVLGGNKYIF